MYIINCLSTFGNKYHYFGIGICGPQQQIWVNKTKYDNSYSFSEILCFLTLYG